MFSCIYMICNALSFVTWVMFNCARKKKGFEWYEIHILGIYVVQI